MSVIYKKIVIVCLLSSIPLQGHRPDPLGVLAASVVGIGSQIAVEVHKRKSKKAQTVLGFYQYLEREAFLSKQYLEDPAVCAQRKWLASRVIISQLSIKVWHGITALAVYGLWKYG